MSLDFWSPAAAPELPSYYRTEDDDPSCRSRLFTGNASEPGPRTCRVNHWETGETLHGAMVGVVPVLWDDAMADRSLVEFGPRPVRQCTECPRPASASGGLCRSCFTAEERVENRETESEDAA